MDALVKDARTAAATEQRPPFFLATVGRGRVGKKLLGRWLAETLRHENRHVEVWDCNPEPPGIRKWFPDARKPKSRDMEDRRRMLEDGITDLGAKIATGKPYDVVLDVGGDDLVLKRLGDRSELDLVATLEAAGIAVVAIHLVGDKADDLRYFESVEKSGLFKPKRACILKNYGMIGAMQQPSEAFAPLLSHTLVEAFQSRGGRISKMEALAQECIEELDKPGQTFHKLAGNAQPLNSKAIRTKLWLRAMDEVRAELAGVLP